MTAFEAINAAGRIILTGIVIYKVTQFRDMSNCVERLGLGMMGSGSFLTVPIILYKNRNPFEGWAVALLTLGAIMLLLGRTYRDHKHWRANKRAQLAAKAYLQGRGKL